MNPFPYFAAFVALLGIELTARGQTGPAPVAPIIKNFQLQDERWTCEADGQPIAGILVKPSGQGPFPALLISHGLGSSAEQFGRSKAREFVKWGLVCIAPDYTHARPGPEADRSSFGASAENLRRARACLAILRTLAEVDTNRMCAYGNSMGAFLTIGLAANQPGALKAAAITAGGVVPAAGYAAPSIESAERIRSPFLILHGSVDTTVLPERSAMLKRALDQHGVPNERRVFAGVGHALHQQEAAEVQRLIREWFTKQGVLKP
jgi:dienelactone hydrolase